MQRAKSSAILFVISRPYFVPVCLVVYLMLRLAIIIFIPITQHSDNLWYYNRAVGLAAGEGYSQNHVLTAFWPVGWPAFLGMLFWLFGNSPVVGQMANLVCSAATFVLALYLASALFGQDRVGRLTVLMLTFYPNEIAYVPSLGTEVFYTAVLMLAVYLLLARRGWMMLAGSGIVFGIATLTKAQTLLIPAVLFAVSWLSPRHKGGLRWDVGKALLVYAAMAVIVLPWTVRNYLVFDAFVPVSTNGGLTLLTGNNPSAQGGYTDNDPLVRKVLHSVSGQVAADHLATSLALTWIREHPAAFVALIPKKVWRLWAPDGEGEWAFQSGFNNYDDYWLLFRSARIFNQLYYSCIMVLFMVSVAYWYRERRSLPPHSGTGYVLAGYFTAISIVFSGQSRFHFVLMPWIAMYSAWTILHWVETGRPVVRSAAA